MKSRSVMVRRGMLCVAVALACCLPGCEDLKVLPTAPSDLTEGAVIYEHANFEGQSAHITVDIADLKDFDGPCEHESSSDSDISYFDWNDCMSSIRVAPGWRVTVYEHDDYRGDSYTSTEDVPNLQLVRGDCEKDGLNDCVTSVRLVKLP